jgi:hypothetical protein
LEERFDKPRLVAFSFIDKLLWFMGFSSRHNLSLKKPQVVENARKKAFFIYLFYHSLFKAILIYYGKQ